MTEASEAKAVWPAHVGRREYDEWIRSAAALAEALRYAVQPSMLNDGTGIVFGDSQYEAFKNGLWSPEPYEVMIIFEALNEPAVDGLPQDAEKFAEYGGLCDKLMILHPGKFCPPHFHPRKTESYEVLLGAMEVFYDPVSVEAGNDEFLHVTAMEPGAAWPGGVELPAGRATDYERLTSFVRLETGSPKFVMHRKHLHAFRCPPDSRTPLVVREISTYSHEPTEASNRRLPLESWAEINDNVFVNDSANQGRLVTKIRP
jgi:D-lyxose ketol-isomerase